MCQGIPCRSNTDPLCEILLGRMKLILTSHWLAEPCLKVLNSTRLEFLAGTTGEQHFCGAHHQMLFAQTARTDQKRGHRDIEEYESATVALVDYLEHFLRSRKEVRFRSC
jgi:hypothetical protein